MCERLLKGRCRHPDRRAVLSHLQGPHCLGAGIVCGGYDLKKHSSAAHAAECELSEECHLKVQRPEAPHLLRAF